MAMYNYFLSPLNPKMNQVFAFAFGLNDETRQIAQLF